MNSPWALQDNNALALKQIRVCIVSATSTSHIKVVVLFNKDFDMNELKNDSVHKDRKL